MKKQSKKDGVKSWLMAGKRITGILALQLYGSYRLSHVIHMLRKEGYTIHSVRRGKERYAEYYMACTDCGETSTVLNDWSKGVALCDFCKRAREVNDVL